MARSEWVSEFRRRPPGNAKLTVDQVKQIKRDLAYGHADRIVAKRNGATLEQVQRIRRGHAWATVTIDDEVSA